MARASFTKYGDDDFVLRMDRDNAMRLLAMLGRSAISDPLVDDEERVYPEMLRQLSEGNPDIDKHEYRVVSSSGNEIPVYRMIKS